MTVGHVTSASAPTQEFHVPEPLSRFGSNGVVLLTQKDPQSRFNFISPPFGSSPISAALSSVTIRVQQPEKDSLQSATASAEARSAFELSISLSVDRVGKPENSYELYLASSQATATLRVRGFIVATVPLDFKADRSSQTFWLVIHFSFPG
jgi:hypothetical protein